MDKEIRECIICKSDISSKNKNAKSCSSYCRTKYYYSKKENRETRNKRVRYRMKNDELYRMRHLYRVRMNDIFRGHDVKSNEVLGCSYEYFKLYIENQFKPWMNWSNRGLYDRDMINYGWDIDHIIPLSTANNLEDLIRLNHYTNLQPLCSKINRDIKKEMIR